TLVAATALATVGVLLPGLTARGYGPMLRSQDGTTYPEVGPQGRYFEGDRFPFGTLASESQAAASAALADQGPPWSSTLRAWAHPREGKSLLALVGLIGLGLGRVAWQDAAARRLLLLAAAAVIAFWISRVAHPYLYLPQRYVSYSLPLLFVIALPVAAGS